MTEPNGARQITDLERGVSHRGSHVVKERVLQSVALREVCIPCDEVCADCSIVCFGRLFNFGKLYVLPFV